MTRIRPSRARACDTIHIGAQNHPILTPSRPQNRPFWALLGTRAREGDQGDPHGSRLGPTQEGSDPQKRGSDPHLRTPKSLDLGVPFGPQILGFRTSDPQIIHLIMISTSTEYISSYNISLSIYLSQEYLYYHIYYISQYILS